MPDEMFTTPDGKGLRRGKRCATRTPTCRPCLVWPDDAPEIRTRGVVLDVNPHGMLVRMLESIPPDTKVTIQIMVDDTFAGALGVPLMGVVRRNIERSGFVDHGVFIEQKEIKRLEEKRTVVVRRTATRAPAPTKMYVMDILNRGR